MLNSMIWEVDTFMTSTVPHSVYKSWFFIRAKLSSVKEAGGIVRKVWNITR